MIEIRSYRRVFDLERRIYRIEGLRLLPGGVPVRGVVYLLVALALAALAAHAPLVRILANAVPWYLTYVAIPLGVATVLGVVRIEGRPFHIAAPGLLGLCSAPAALRAPGARSFARPRWHPEVVVFLPDGSDSQLRALLYRGPGVALVRVEHRRAVLRGSRGLVLEAGRHAAPLARPALVSLAPGAQLRIREWREARES